ncbi:phage tail protein [Geobacillus kaustophilus]|uniref:phage tail protein n=1 Tax=Geobacillus kaustophilus TaxID=1462 RepID=UPI0005CCD3C3|nr:phage tail protein [Geobacillus kaustophilus]
MAKIGSFAGVVFEVSSQKVLTFDEFEREGGSRWHEHEIVGRKPAPEFLGPGLERIKFVVKVSSFLGVNPADVIRKLRSARDNGLYSKFIIGNATISSSSWVLTELREIHKIRGANGLLVSADLELTLVEYPEPYKPPAATSKPKPPPPKTNTSKKGSIGKVIVKVGMLNLRSGPSLKAKIVRVLRKGQAYKVYGTVKTDITWYKLGGGTYVSANPKYVIFEKM